MLANDAFLIPQEESLVDSDIYGGLKRKMHSGRGGKDCSDKCASENMNMKMYCDPGAELFSSTLMPTATLVSLPKAAQVPLSMPWSGI